MLLICAGGFVLYGIYGFLVMLPSQTREMSRRGQL